MTSQNPMSWRFGISLLSVSLLRGLLTLNPAGVRAATVPVIDTATPSALVRSVVKPLLSDISAHRAEYAADPTKLDALVRKVVLPHFDSELAAREVLARHWDDATIEQRHRFTDALYHFMLHDLGSKLVDFNLHHLQVFSNRGDPTSQFATVETVVRRHSGELIHVNYALHRTKSGWKIYDLAFSGVSVLVSFEQDFRAEIEQKGLDELISRLAES